MANKFLNYTKLTHRNIISQINDKLSNDSRFKNFRESAIAKMLIEIFAGVTDFTNYYIERRAEESYLETAELKSSIIQLAKQLGYVITRPIPSNASISITLKGGSAFNSISAGDYILFPQYSEFEYQGTKFILKKSYKYVFTVGDVTNLATTGYEKTITYALQDTEDIYQLYKDADLVNITDTETIDLVQGERKTYTINGEDNEQVGKNFQIYKINDDTFSNYYGSEDFDVPVTEVSISGSGSSARDFSIDRRSLITQSSLLGATGAADVCVIRTALDGAVELLFGDGNYASLGAETTQDDVIVNYLSTLGANANLIGVIGEKITCNTSLSISNGSPISNSIDFKLTTNITDGANIESNDSIKNSAPSIYYALDRLVTNDDYVAYLKSLTSPINTKNALAWGEQEEGGNVTPIKKLFNVALFTCFGELYNKVIDTNGDENWFIKNSDTGVGGELSDAVLDEVDLFSELPDNNYFDLLVKETSPGESTALASAHIADSTSKIGQVYTKINDKSQITVRNVYVSPIIHEYEITGSVYIEKLADSVEMKTEMQNLIYEFLNENADFNSDIYESNLVELLEQPNEVKFVNVNLVPEQVGRTGLGSTTATDFGDAILEDDQFVNWVSANSVPITVSANITAAMVSAFKESVTGNTSDWNTIKGTNTISSDITEEWFQKTLLNNFYSRLKDETSGTDFMASDQYKSILVRIHNDISYQIKYNLMRNTTGTKTRNITNYSLKNEIAKVKFNINVFYE